MDTLHDELAIGKTDEAMATAARERRRRTGRPVGVLARPRALLAPR